MALIDDMKKRSNKKIDEMFQNYLGVSAPSPRERAEIQLQYDIAMEEKKLRDSIRKEEERKRLKAEMYPDLYNEDGTKKKSSDKAKEVTYDWQKEKGDSSSSSDSKKKNEDSVLSKAKEYITKGKDGKNLLDNLLAPNEYEKQKKEKSDKKKAKKEKKKEQSFLDDVVDAVKGAGQALNPFDDVSMGEAFKKTVDKAKNTERSGFTKELNRGVTNVANSATMGALKELDRKVTGSESPYFEDEDRGMGGKAADMVYNLTGSLVPGTAVAKGLRGLGLGAKSNSIGQLAKEGAIAGGTYAAGEIGIRELINGDDYDAEDNIRKFALDSTLGAILDPAIVKGSGAISNYFKKRNQASTGIPEVDELLALPAPQEQLALPAPKEPLGLPAPGSSPVKRPAGKASTQDINEFKAAIKAEEDAFVSSRLKGVEEDLKLQQELEAEFHSIKQLQEEGKRIKAAYGTLYIPEGNQSDFDVPVRFRAGKNRKDKAYDVYKAADEEGFSSVDEFVSYLKQLDQAMKTKKSDIVPKGTTASQYQKLQEQARKEFRESDTYKGLNQFLDELVGQTKASAPTRQVGDFAFKSQADEVLSAMEVPVAERANESIVQHSGDHIVLRNFEELAKKRLSKGPNIKAHIEQEAKRLANLPDGHPDKHYGAFANTNDWKNLNLADNEDWFSKFAAMKYELNKIGYDLTDIRRTSNATAGADIVPLNKPTKAEPSAKAVDPIDEMLRNITDSPGPSNSARSSISDDDAIQLELDRHLKSAKPRYGYKGNLHQLEFENELDKAIYIATSNNQSKSKQKFIDAVTVRAGMSEADMKATGKRIRETLKRQAQNSTDGDVITVSSHSSSGVTDGVIPGASPTGTMSRGIDYGGVRAKNKDVPYANPVARAFNNWQKTWSDDAIFTKVAENEIKGVNRFKGGSGKAHRAITNVRGAAGYAQYKLDNELLPILQDFAKETGRPTEDLISYQTAKHLKETVKVQREAYIDRIKELAKDPKYSNYNTLPGIIETILSSNKPTSTKMQNLKGLAAHVPSKRMRELVGGVINPYKLPGTKTKDGKIVPLTEEELDDVVTRLGSDAKVEEYSQKYNEWNKSILDFLVDSGVMSSSQRDELLSKYANYIPKFREVDVDSADVQEKAYTKMFAGTKLNPVGSIEGGSHDPIADPVKNFVMHTQSAIRAGMENKARLALYDLIQHDKKGKWVSPMSRGKTDNELTVRVDGEEKTFYVSKELKETYDQIKSISPDAPTGFIKSVAAVQRLSIVGTPAFMLRSIMKDIPEAWITSNSGMSIIRDLPLAAMDLISNGKILQKMGKKSLIEDFYRDGAGMTTIWAQDSNQFAKFQQQAYKVPGAKVITAGPTEKKAWSAISYAFDRYRDVVLDTVENLPKMAEYRSSVRKGLPGEEAAFNARDVYDHNKAGTFVRKVNPFVSFLNATIRGRDKMGRALTERFVPTATKATLAAGGASVAAYLITDALANDEQKKVINEAPQWLRDTYWLIPDITPTGGKENRIIRIPKPYESAALISTPIEMLFREYNGQDIDYKNEALAWAKQNIWFDPSLNPAQPILETVTNKDTFTGNDIIPMREQSKDVDSIDQQDVNTPLAAIKMAEVFNALGLEDTILEKLASPRIQQNLLDGYFPTAGTQASDTVEKILTELGVVEDRNRPNYKTAAHAPVTQFFMDTRDWNSPAIGDMYDLPPKMRALKAAEGGETDEDFSMAEEYTEVNAAIKEMNDLASEIRAVENDADMGPAAKRERVRDLKARRNEIVRYFKDNGLIDYVKEQRKALREAN